MLIRVVSTAVACALSTIALADAVVWNYNGQAVATGTGCNTDPSNPDTFIVVAGEEVSVVFSKLGANLADEFSPLNMRHTCIVRLPMRVAKGNYIGELTQTFLYGITKSPRSNGSVAARATFFTFPAASFEDKFPTGTQRDEPLLEKTIRNDYRIQASSWCTTNRAMEGEYKLNLAINAARASLADSIVVQVDGADIKFSALAGMYNCNL